MSISITWEDERRGWRAHLAAGGRASGSIRLRDRHVLAAARELNRPVHTVTLDDLELFIARDEWSPAYRRSLRASLRLFFHWCYRRGLADDDPAAELAPIIQPRSLPRPVSERDTSRALRCRDERTAVMVALMALCGLRRAEVATVRGSDVIDGVHGPILRVTGKGRHVREVPMPAHLARAVRARGDGWTFPGQIDGHLSPRRVGELVRDVLPPGMTGHQLRHRYATAVYARSHDIRAVQSLLGHARLDTTAIYVAVAADDAARAAASAWRVA